MISTLLKTIILAASMSATTAFAASFDCNLAKSITEKTICEQRFLNDADVKMATAYQIIRRLMPMGTRSIIQNDQVKWISLRDQCQADLECLKHMYQMRQQKLEIYLDRVYKQGPF